MRRTLPETGVFVRFEEKVSKDGDALDFLNFSTLSVQKRSSTTQTLSVRTDDGKRLPGFFLLQGWH